MRIGLLGKTDGIDELVQQLCDDAVTGQFDIQDIAAGVYFVVGYIRALSVCFAGQVGDMFYEVAFEPAREELLLMLDKDA